MRKGLSLIELLVVVAILAVLLGLLLPAVQKVREASNRSKCQANMKQIGLAIQSYASLYESYPPAYANTATATDDWRPGWGWGALLLPFAEQAALYKQLRANSTAFGLNFNPAKPDQVTQTSLPLYLCPSNDAPRLNSFRYEFAAANYRAVCGFGNGSTVFIYASNQDTGGAMFQNSRIRPSDILDGTANTLAVGECVYDAFTGKESAIWPGMPGTDPDGVMISAVMWIVDEYASRVNGEAIQAFSSRHPGGAFFTFCDGSVRFFAEGGDVIALKYLAGRRDGHVVSPDF